MSPLWISLATSLAATAITFCVGIAAAALMFRYRGRWRGLIDGLLILPLVLPPTVVGFFLLLMFGRHGFLGITLVFTWPATVLAASAVAFPLMYRATLGGFEQVNPNLLGAARTLGAGEWRCFRCVLLPLAWPAVISGTVLAFARALGEFGATLMLAGNIPGRTQTMPIAIFFAAEGGDLRQALLWVALITAISLAAVAALNYRMPPRRVARISAAPRFAPAPAQQGDLTVDIQSTAAFPLCVTFTASGDAVGLLGASGSGKSMTLRCIAGIEPGARGRIVLNGRVLLDSSAGVHLPPAERRIGLVFQDSALFPHLSVAANIAFGLRRGTPAEWARLVQIDDLLERYPSELSGGQSQRVALARALATEPEALLLDEPFSALDPHLRRQMEEQLRETLGGFRGVTLFVTHDRDEAFRFCENLVVLDGGRVAASGPKRGLFADPGTVAVARLTGCKNIAPPEEWGMTAPAGITHLGIRAHDVTVTAQAETGFPCWLMHTVDSPFETTLYLRLHAPPQPGDHWHMEAEMTRAQWAALAPHPQPWRVDFDPAKLIRLRP